MLASKQLRFGLMGAFLLVLTLGSYFSRFLANHNYTLLIISIFFLLVYFHNHLLAIHDNKKIPMHLHIGGFLGFYTLVLLFGVQSPQLPYKAYLIIIALLLLFPTLSSLLRK